MDEVCSNITSTLRDRLKTHWNELLTPAFAEMISGKRLEPTEVASAQEDWWERITPHLLIWTERQAKALWRKKLRRAQSEREAAPVSDTETSTAVSKLRTAVRQLILVRVLVDQSLPSTQEKRVREALWLELAPHVERTAKAYARSAAKRGFEVEDLIQDASAHFQQVITRFNPEDSRRAMLATWFDDVVDNLFAAAVRPRKADALKRGIGGVGEEEVPADEMPTSPKQAVRYVRDYQRQQEVEDSLRQVDEICTKLVESGVCPLERVLAFKLYVTEGLTYQEVAETLKTRGYQYGTTQMFNFVKEVKAHVLGRFEGDPFASQ